MNKRDFGVILQIGDVLVSEEVITAWFACDYSVCKGACCIEGDSGAPLDEDEPEALERDYGAFSSLMSERGRRTISEKGFFEIDIQNDMVTPVVPLTNECAYACIEEGGNCLCAIEKCHLQGGCALRKPRSCSLYPIRVTHLTGGGQALNLHHWSICKSAFERGEREGIRVWQFLRGPLTQYYGADFYDALCAGAAQVLDAME